MRVKVIKRPIGTVDAIPLDKFQIGETAIDIHRNIGDVDPFVLQQGGNIAHQALTIIRLDRDRHRESMFHLSPVDLQEAFFVFAMQDIRTILAMDRRSASTRNITDDLIAGLGVAALCHCGHQTF